VPKTYLPNYKEFYDERWYESGANARCDEVRLADQTVPFGTDLLFQIQGLPGGIFGVEVCEDLWVPLAPHEFQAAAGALVLFNISASNEVLRKPDWRRTLITSESGRCLSA
jgi:NAD+ synthase (glutamine-hydrolysing)